VGRALTLRLSPKDQRNARQAALDERGLSGVRLFRIVPVA